MATQFQEVTLNEVYDLDKKDVEKIKFLYHKLNLLKILITLENIDKKIIDDYIECGMEYDIVFSQIISKFTEDKDCFIDFEKNILIVKKGDNNERI